MTDPDLERLIAAGAGHGPHAVFVARLCVSLDQYVSETAEGDPARAAQALAELGMTKTAALFGLTDQPVAAAPWDELDGLAGYGRRETPAA